MAIKVAVSFIESSNREGEMGRADLMGLNGSDPAILVGERVRGGETVRDIGDRARDGGGRRGAGRSGSSMAR